MKISPFALGSFMFVAIFASASMAQVQRTFVSGLGNDGNPCSRTAPCRTFTQAISQTNAGGEVVALDSGGYGPFTITQSVTVQAPPGVYAGISVFSATGIIINAGAQDTVNLRGLTVNNQGGANGVVFNTGAKLHLEDCVINGFSNTGNAGLAILGGANVEVIDSVMRSNYSGIFVLPSSGTTRATIDHVRFEGNGNGLLAREGSSVTVSNSALAGNGNGVLADSLASAPIKLNLENTTLSGNSSAISATAASTGPVQVNVARCVISNGAGGIFVSSASTGVATVRLSSSTVTGNIEIALWNFGPPALLLSRGDNTVEGNGTDTIGTIGSYMAK